MTCDPQSLMDSARCFKCVPNGSVASVAIHLLCIWAAVEVESPPPPCLFSISPGAGGTIILHWQNPIVYDSIEIWHTSLTGGFRHLETTLVGTATSYNTPILAAGDFFIVRGVLGDDKSPFAIGGPC